MTPETPDPWKDVERIYPYSDSMQPDGPACYFADTVDAARAADDARHQQEIAALKAAAEAEDKLNVGLFRALSAELSAAEATIASLTAERDQLAKAVCPDGELTGVALAALAEAHRVDSECVDEYLSTVDETNLSGAYQVRAKAIRAERDRLHAALTSVQSQCTGHADEFSRFVWLIAQTALTPCQEPSNG